MTEQTRRAGGPRIAIVGGGITGLAAALRLRERAPAGTTITVYEQSGVVGGKLRTGSVGGATVEYGAEAFLTSDPAGGESAAVALARRVGLDEALVHPSVGQAALAIDGTLRPVPGGTLVGVPGDLDRLAGVVRPVAERDRDEGRPLLEVGQDVAVGTLVRARLGDEVVDRLVDPMLGGVYAGRADELSLTATLPALARAARTATTLTGAVRAAQATRPRTPGSPVFTTVAGGLSRLVDGVRDALTGHDGGPGARVTVSPDTTVRELARTATGWQLTLGPVPSARQVEVDAVLLATPARPAARLLAGVHAGVAERVGRLDYASVALVTLALPPVAMPELSGFLVPADQGRLMKAATFFTTKWAHLRRPDGLVLVRASVGRRGEEEQLQRPDEELVATVRRELAELTGVALPPPVQTHVQRWGGALPQYAPGHLERVAGVRAVLRAEHPTLTLAGAAYDGVGIPICIRSGQTAADRIIDALGGSQGMSERGMGAVV